MRDRNAEIVDLPSGAAPVEAGPAFAPRGPRRRLFGEGAQIACDNLVKIYKVADLEVVALQGLDLLVDPGEMIAIVGASGSRQVDAPEHPRRPRRAVGRARHGRRPRPRPPWVAASGPSTGVA